MVEIFFYPNRVFNTDKTESAQNRKFEEACCSHGVKTLCEKSVYNNLHLTITACVSANIFVLTPVFVSPGQ